jgi:hypothetical protein
MAYSNIKDPSAHFQVKKWTGNAGTNAITLDGNSDMQPDFMWHKEQYDTNGWHQFDSSRGVTKYFATQSNGAEGTFANYLTSFDSNGFTAGPGDSSMNSSGTAQCSWMWHCNGGTTSSNTAGGTTTTVQANQDAGFSIVTWTGNGATTTLGHGLGVTPDVIIQKARGTTSNWAVYHKDAGPAVSQASYNVVTYLNLTDATGIASNSWGTAPSDINSNTFYLKYWFNYNATNVAYCFAEKQGYSRFGKYIGTGARDYAPFIYTGFKPAFVMVRCSNITGQWLMFDSTRNPYNGDFDYVLANLGGAESDSGLSFVDPIDFLSNGFRVMNYDAWMNGGNNTYIYMAFAENPFVAGGIPTTAR